MGRTVVTKADGPHVLEATGGAETPDDYKSRLLKYIPAEVVSVYIAVVAILKAGGAGSDALWIVFVLGIVGTVAYLRRVAKVTKWGQIVVSAIAFVVWVLAAGGPFEAFPWYRDHRFYGAAALPIYTFVIALWEA